LRPAKPIPAGTRIKCSKCATVFAAPELEDPDAPVLVDDGVALEEDEELDSPPPKQKPGRLSRPSATDEADDLADEDDLEDRPRKKAPNKRKKGKKKKERGRSLTLPILVGALVVLLLGTGGYFFANFIMERRGNRGTGQEDPLAYVPAEFTSVRHVDYAAMLSLPEIGSTIQLQLEVTLGSLEAKLREKIGGDFNDFYSQITIAEREDTGGEPPRLFIVQSRQPFDQAKVRQSTTNPVAHSHAGKRYFSIEDRPYKWLFMPCNTIVVLSNLPEKEWLDVVARDGSQVHLPAPLAGLIQKANGSSIWVAWEIGASARSAIGRPSSGQNSPQFAGMVPPSLKGPIDNAKAVGIWFGIDGKQISAHGALQCKDEADAKKFAKAADDAMNNEIKGQLSLATFALPKEVGKALTEFFGSLKFSSRGSDALFQAKLSTDAIVTIAKFNRDQLSRMQQPGGLPGGS
jgi:hypothetical protein